MATRRNLRNSNTCPSSHNPFALDGEDPIKSYVPPNISRYIPSTSTITCTQITTLPIFRNQNSLEDALQFMRRASDWQSREINQLKKGEINASEDVASAEVHEGMGEGERGPAQQGKVWPESHQLVGQILDIDLRGFLMEPPNPIIDFEYSFNPLLIQPESIQESSPLDFEDPDF